MGVLERTLRVQIVSAELSSVITALAFSGIDMQNVVYTDLLTAEAKIRQSQYHSVRIILQKQGATCKVLSREGILWSVLELMKRPMLTCGLLVFAMLACMLPSKIFFVKVSGNEKLTDNHVLSKAEECGIKFGSIASDVRSEKVKNHLLSMLPELQWVGVNTSGCVATIHVKERSQVTEPTELRSSISSIVAAQDGVITGLTVLKGTPLFSPGQAVQKGDILVSGYTDCGIKVLGENAQAEVMANTMREIIFLTMSPTERRGVLIHEHTCYKLQIGKKVINLCNHSGIPDATCVKMYSEYYCSLPGGFRLPLSVKKVNCSYYESEDSGNANEETYSWLLCFARKYLKQQMIAGEILSEEILWVFSEDCCALHGSYACHEMIGRVKYEENMNQNAEDN